MRPAQAADSLPHRDLTHLLASVLAPPGAVLEDGRIRRRFQPRPQLGFLVGSNGARAAGNRFALQRARRTVLHHGPRHRGHGDIEAASGSCSKPTVEPTYWDRCETLIRLYDTPQLGKVPLTKLAAQQVQQLHAYVLDLPRSPGAVTKLHVVLHKALEDAVKLGLVYRNVPTSSPSPRSAVTT